MADVYVIGDPKGQQRVGVARDAAELLAEMQASSAPGLEVQSWRTTTGRAGLTLRAFELKFQRYSMAPEWYAINPETAHEGVETILAKVEAFATSDARAARPDLSGLMLHLRTNVFRTTQETMGEICGRSLNYVSRWEAGVGSPGLEELLRIRAAALSLGLPWDDAEILDLTRDFEQVEGHNGQ